MFAVAKKSFTTTAVRSLLHGRTDARDAGFFPVLGLLARALELVQVRVFAVEPLEVLVHVLLEAVASIEGEGELCGFPKMNKLASCAITLKEKKE